MKLKICPYPYCVWVSDVTFLVLHRGAGRGFFDLTSPKRIEKTIAIVYSALRLSVSHIS